VPHEVGLVADKDAGGTPRHHIGSKSTVQKAQRQHGAVESGTVGNAVDDAIAVRKRR